jgi:hypothetical protein
MMRRGEAMRARAMKPAAAPKLPESAREIPVDSGKSLSVKPPVELDFTK